MLASVFSHNLLMCVCLTHAVFMCLDVFLVFGVRVQKILVPFFIPGRVNRLIRKFSMLLIFNQDIHFDAENRQRVGTEKLHV